MDGPNLGVRLGRQEGIEVAGLLPRLDLAHTAVVADVDPGEKGERFRVVPRQSKPDGAISALGIAARLAEGREGDEATVGGGQPGLPVAGGGVAAMRLNGIEGVALTTASRRLLRDVQASGMTSAQPLGAIVAAFKT